MSFAGNHGRPTPGNLRPLALVACVAMSGLAGLGVATPFESAALAMGGRGQEIDGPQSKGSERSAPSVKQAEHPGEARRDAAREGVAPLENQASGTAVAQAPRSFGRFLGCDLDYPSTTESTGRKQRISWSEAESPYESVKSHISFADAYLGNSKTWGWPDVDGDFQKLEELVNGFRMFAWKTPGEVRWPKEGNHFIVKLYYEKKTVAIMSFQSSAPAKVQAMKELSDFFQRIQEKAQQKEKEQRGGRKAGKRHRHHSGKAADGAP